MAVRRRLLALVAAAATTLLLPLPAAVSAQGGVGAPGVGDPYFPRSGNGGIDVRHYDLRLDYQPPRSAKRLVGHLSGDARLVLRTTQPLSRFDLDLRGLRVSRVLVDGTEARFAQQGGELQVTPRKALRSGQQVRVRVQYAGRTGRPTDSEDALYGWVTTADGAVVANQPDGAPTWFPANDHPTDKASYRIAVRVPKGKVAVANGRLAHTRTAHGRTTWVWSAPDPMASYLATATVGDFRLTRSTAAGVPVIDAVDRDLGPSAAASLRRTGEMIGFLSQRFGRYPFGSYGAIVDDDELGYALETQTRSLFTGVPDESTVLHELAHQWMGDAVSPHRWSDIWLNEGWATYAEWLWAEHRGGATAQQSYADVLARPSDDPFWRTTVADPGRDGIFSAPVYERGAATLHALRLRVGDQTFFAIARAWVRTHSGGDASTVDFERLAERVSGQQLDDLFTAWVHTPRKPSA